MALVERRREMAEVERLLECAAGGQGGVLVITGPPGSGRTELAAAAAREGARRGFQVLRTAVMRGQPGPLAWAQLLHDAGAPDDLAARLLDEAGPMDLDTVARALAAGSQRLLVIDDIDHGGPEALRVLRVVAARAAASTTAVVVTSVLPPGLGTELRLGGLSLPELAAVTPDVPSRARHALWLASRGLPGVAMSLAAGLAASGDNLDPLVHLALAAPSQAEFLDVDTGLVRLLEMAIPRAPDDRTKARLLARLLDEAVGCLQEATAFAESAGALPGQVLSLEHAAGALSLRQAPGDREKASACRVRAAAIAERLGVTGMLGRLAPASGQWALRRDGEDWLLEAGAERARLRDSRGLHYLRALLAAPGSEIPALDLVAGGPGLVVLDTETLLDATGRETYRHRIRQLDSELAAADRAGDSMAGERAQRERQALIGELRRATGLAGRPRRAAADAERARVNVTRTIRAAIDRIMLAAPIAGAHLQSSIRTGTACRYQPAAGGPARWHT